MVDNLYGFGGPGQKEKNMDGVCPEPDNLRYPGSMQLFQCGAYTSEAADNRVHFLRNGWFFQYVHAIL